jgi:hypothetical protein
MRRCGRECDADLLDSLAVPTVDRARHAVPLLNLNNQFEVGPEFG